MNDKHDNLINRIQLLENLYCVMMLSCRVEENLAAKSSRGRGFLDASNNTMHVQRVQRVQRPHRLVSSNPFHTIFSLF